MSKLDDIIDTDEKMISRKEILDMLKELKMTVIDDEKALERIEKALVNAKAKDSLKHFKSAVENMKKSINDLTQTETSFVKAMPH